MSGQRGTVLQVILSRERAGTETHVAELSRALVRRGWRVVVAARAGADPAALAGYSASAEVAVLPDLPAPLLGPALAGLARRHRARLIHCHLGAATMASVAAAPLARVPVVATAHFLAPRHTTRRPRRLWAYAQRRLIRRVGAVIAISEAVAKTAAAGGARRVFVVHNGIDPRPAPARRDGPGRPVLLFAGRFHAEKQPRAGLVAAAAARPECELRFAGDGPLREAVEAEARVLAPGRAAFLGWIQDLDPELAAARALVLPSAAEPFGLVALEAMRAGVPVAGFAAGALPEIVSHGETGLLVAPGDVPALAAALSTLAADPNLARSLGAAGRRRFERMFTSDEMAAGTEAVYFGRLPSGA